MNGFNFNQPINPNIHSTINQVYQLPQLDAKQIAELFITTYYSNFGNSGWVNNLDLFSEKCFCLINGDIFHGAYQILINYAKINFHRMQITKVAGAFHTITNNIIVNCVMKGSPVSPLNQLLNNNEYTFSENFVINLIDNKYKIIHYNCIIT